MDIIKKSRQEIIITIESDIFEALNMLFDRVISKSKNKIIIEDKKKPEEREGVVQDSEFGMMVCMGYEWLSSRMNLSNTALNRKDVEDFMIKLVKESGSKSNLP
jgi:hypothetical protein